MLAKRTRVGRVVDRLEALDTALLLARSPQCAAATPWA
jgi:hypothetical protein